MIASDRPRAPRLALMLVALGAAALPARASAEPQGASAASQRPLAEALFREGKKLLREGRVADACRKLEASQKLDPAAGTLLNLATCHEKEGRTATAWAEYKSSLEMARKANRPDRARIAEKGAAALEPKLARLTLTSGAAPAPGLVVELDGVELGRGAFDTAMPIDPGPHVLRASAPDMQPFEATIDVEPGDPSRTFAIPPLAPVPKPEPPPAAPPPAPASGRWRLPLGIGAGTLGLVALGMGAGFGAKALRLGGEARDQCGKDGACSPAGYAAWQDGRSAATAADVLLIAGAVAATAGVVLVVTAPRGEPSPAPSGGPTASLVPAVGPGGGAIYLRSTW
jgi:hypothetical protein